MNTIKSTLYLWLSLILLPLGVGAQTITFDTVQPEAKDATPRDVLAKFLYGMANGKFGDPIRFYTITNALSVTNLTNGAPFYGLLSLTNISDGTKCPELVYLQAKNRDGFAFDFEWQPFSSPPTNGTYTAGTPITAWGNDYRYLVAVVGQSMLTNTWGATWTTNGGVALFNAPAFVHPIPLATGETNCQFLILSKGTYTFTNGVEWTFGVKQ